MAEAWLNEQGMEAVDGPINFGEKDKFWGLLVDNFDDLPSYGMNYNRPYYRAVFRSPADTRCTTSSSSLAAK